MTSISLALFMFKSTKLLMSQVSTIVLIIVIECDGIVL